MTKQARQLEKRIEALEKELAELKNQLFALALRPVVVTPPVFPAVAPPLPIPNTAPTWPPYMPYIGDPPPGTGPTFTCGNQTTQHEKK